MSNRWVRFLIAVAAISTASAAVYFAIQKEQQLSRETATTHTAELAIESALVTLVEMKATLHAYVAPGQGLPFWVARSGVLIDRLRATVVDVDPAAATAGVSLTESLDACDRLAATEQRIREHMRAGQALLAGEVIFNDARDLLDSMRIQLAHARDQIRIANGSKVTAARQEQMRLLGAAAAALAIGLLLLVLPPKPVVITDQITHDAPAQAPALAPALAPAPAPAPALAPAPAPAPSTEHPAPGTSHPAPELATICSDIARMTDVANLSSVLERMQVVLDANGLIVWLVSADGDSLYPAASAGYDPRLLAKIGSIPRDASNLTAAAFRANEARTSLAEGHAAAALAVPLPTPNGCAGVLSAEIKGIAEVDPSRLAAAEIAAAQLAMVIGSATLERRVANN